jgi:thiol:disulfide interchange protein
MMRNSPTGGFDVRRLTPLVSTAIAIIAVTSCGGPTAAPEPEPTLESVRSHSAVELKWESDWDDAFSRARDEGKPVMANFYAEWCVWCKHLETVTFRDEKVATMLADSVVPLNIDIDGNAKNLVRDHQIQAPPTIVLFSTDGEELGRIPGFLPPSNFLTVVQKILAGEPVKFS